MADTTGNEIENVEEKKTVDYNAADHYHTLKKKDGKYSVIKEVDEYLVEEISDDFDTEDAAKAEMTKLAEDAGASKQEANDTDDNMVNVPDPNAKPEEIEISDSYDEDTESNPEEVKQYEEELSKQLKK